MVTQHGKEIVAIPVRTRLGIGANGREIVTGDLNNDGIDDAVTLHNSEDLLVHLANGDGSFDIASRIDLPASGESTVKLVDWDQDGTLDLLAANPVDNNGNPADNSVWLLLGRGDGSFDSPLVQPISSPRYLATADFDLDGHLDFVTADGWNSVSVVFGQGSEGFGEEATIGFASPNLDALVAGDFNGDSIPDVALSYSETGGVVQILGNGDRTFQAGQQIAVLPLTTGGGGQTQQIVAPTPIRLHFYADGGDFNADGYDDLVVVGSESSNLSVLLGGPDGLNLTNHHGLRDDGNALDVKVVDANDDGHLDVFVRDYRDTHLYRGRGDGSFDLGQLIPIDVEDVAIIDVNRDGHSDLLGLDRSGFVSVLANTNDSYDLPLAFPRTESSAAVAATLADFNEDGVSDLVIAHRMDNLTVLRGLPDGSFERDSRLQLAAAGASYDIISVDLDDDGILDLLTANPGSASWNWLRGLGEASFAEPVMFRDLNAHSIAADDINDDGRLDVVVGHGAYQGLSVWLGTEDGLPELSSRIPLPESRITKTLVLGDLNEDEILDIVAHSLAGEITLLKGDGAGGFSAGETIDASAGSLLVEDLNADTHLDLAVTSGGVAIYYGAGDGTFEAPVSVTESLHPSVNAAGDVNQDGKPDLLAWSRSFDHPVLLIQRDGEFDAIATELPEFLQWAFIRDVNADGNADLLGGDQNFFGVQLAVGDEDGITWVDGAALPAGGRAHIRVDLRETDQRANYLDAWIDFNRDGDWSDEGEHVLDSVDLGAGDGLRDLDFAIPETADFGATYARFRLSSGTELTPTGTADDGEVEDYRVEIVPARPTDFGDAPTSSQTGFATSYPTTVGDDGARHIIGGPRLGSLVDGETDGLPTFMANGDDAFNVNDADGVQFGPLIAGATATATITVTGAGGQLDAWIDFNRDGDWLDFGEQIENGLAFTAGQTRFMTFNVPNDAAGETLFARFRVSSAGQLAPGGFAADGEVEDYRLPIEDAATAQTFRASLSVPVEVPADAHVQVVDDDLVVTNHGIVIMRAPLTAVAELTVSGTEHDDRVRLTVPSAVDDLLIIDGGDGVDLLRSVDAESGDFRITSAQQTGFESLDLRNGSTDSLRLNSLDSSMVPPHVVWSDATDTFDGAAGWRLGTPVIENGEFYRVVRRDEIRLLLQTTAPWRNPIKPLDVSGNADVEPLDALQIINALNSGAFPSVLPNPIAVAVEDYRYLDTTADGSLSPLDALVVINFLNRPRGTAGS